VANLSGGVVNPFEGVKQGDIIVARELLPSDMAMLELDSIRGFVTAMGSTTSHTCIIARNHSLAVVVGLGDAVEQIATGDTLIVDSTEDRVVVNPDSETMDSYLVRELNLEALRREQQQVAMQSVEFNGEAVAVTANAASVEEVVAAIEAGADGIGLFRSEFLYLNSTVEPTEQQQYCAYSAAARACGGRPLTIRTLDIGGDKAVPYLNFEREENPFLGWRAIRVSLECREMFHRQLRALLRASAHGSVRVMFPMISCLEELRQAKAELELCKGQLETEGVAFDRNIEVGVMIETPAAVLVADSLACECDFFSIGTNDLTQYIMAADRANSRVAKLYNPYSEAVLRAVEMTLDAADRADIECGMCGELASDSAATAMLADMGLSEFSVNVGAVAEIKWTISKL
jgi:phosphotransferase system enzyme I (PtsI)